MSKVNVSTAQGQTSVLDEASVRLPTEQVPTPEAPSGGGSILDGIISAAEGIPADTGSAETASIIGEGISAGLERQGQLEEQRGREQIQPLAQRFDDSERVDRWKPQQKLNETEPNNGSGGLFARAKQLAGDFESGRVGISARPTGESLAAFREGGVDALLAAEQVRDPGSFIAAVNQAGAVDNQVTDTGNVKSVVDPTYLTIGAAVTENVMADLAFGEQDPTVPEEVVAQSEGRAPLVSKAQNNQALGQQIHREYMRRKNNAEGLPVDQYQDLPAEQATTLGDAFKELYAASMGPDMISRVIDPKTKQVYYQLTDPGVSALKASAQARKRMFPKTNIRPQKTPTSQLRGEQRREVKKVTGRVGTPVGMETLEKAAHNLNQIPNVVDKQRMRILYSTVLPALAGREGLDSIGATINNFGADKMAKFVAQEAAARKEGDTTYSADENMQALQDSIAQAVRGVAMERNGANHFTYTIQAFNGRMAPQQTFFDATSSKAVRFVTRNATPVKIEKGSRQDKALRQMYAMMLVKGADTLLPERREIALQRSTQQLYSWGQRLQTILDQSMTDAEAEAVSQAIEQGKPMTDPSFPQVRGFQFNPDTDADLMAAIKSKGEDGPHFIDGVIDFKNYMDAHKAGRPYHSYFNAYMDGKTNGIASNGIQMGSREVALATGVIRNNKKELLDDGDIRDQLKKDLIHNLLNNGFDGTIENTAAMTDVAKAVYSYRDLNKATTMTFGYGKELGSFGKDIAETVSFFEQLAHEGGTEAAARTWVVDQDFMDFLENKPVFKGNQNLSQQERNNLFANEFVEFMLQKEANVRKSESVFHDYTDPDGTKVDIKMVYPAMTAVAMADKGIEFAKRAGDQKPDYIEIWDKIEWPKEFKVGAKVMVRPRGRISADAFYSNVQDREVSRTGNQRLNKQVPIDSLEPSPYASVTDSVKKHGLETFGQSLAAMDEEMGRDELIGTLLNLYNESLAGVLSDEAIDSRSLMRSAAVLHAVTNSLFSIKSYTGFDLNLGGEETLGWEGADTTAYDIWKDGKKHKSVAARYQTEPTSAAIRWRTDEDDNLTAEPGGDAYGGSLPGPVQSLDAATVAMTVTGKSWDKLKSRSGGNPYIHTIFDAFKVDANGYDTVLEEVNNNWLKASMEWSYLEQTYDATKETMQNFWNEIGKLDPNEAVDISMSGPYRMMGYLLDPTVSQSGKFPSRLRNKLNNLMQKPKGIDPDAWEDATFKATLRITEKLKKAGFDLKKPEGATVNHLKTFVRALQDELHLAPRMNAMIKHTNEKKKELAKEIRSSGPVYQYYAH